MDTSTVLFAFGLTLFAGLSTGIGSALAFYTKKTNASFLSGLSERIGALLGYFILYNFLSEALFGIVFAGVAGIMVYISIDEVLPTAEKYGNTTLQ